jgi:hypothetical protein
MLLAPGATHAQGAGVIEGQVVNGTEGGPEIGAGVPVVLRAFDGVSELDVQETVTGDGGTFRFDGLDTEAGLEYWPEAAYKDVTYVAPEGQTFSGEETSLQVMLNVYETTTDDSAIRIGSVHLIVESFGEMLRVNEIYLLSNTGDRTYVGEAGEGDVPVTVLMTVPDNAVGVAANQDEGVSRYVEVEGGLRDTEPVPPGTEASLAVFSYHLIGGGDSVDLVRSFAYPVAVLNVLVVQPGLELQSDQLVSRGLESFQDRNYLVYATGDVPAGSSVAMALIPAAGGASMGIGSEAGGVEVSAGSSMQRSLMWVGAVLALLVVAVGFVYPAVTRAPAPARGRTPDLTGNPGARRLVAELADLEEARDEGEVDDGEYERRRAELYDALRDPSTWTGRSRRA